jgi:hypothetical protein
VAPRTMTTPVATASPTLQEQFGEDGVTRGRIDVLQGDSCGQKRTVEEAFQGLDRFE